MRRIAVAAVLATACSQPELARSYAPIINGEAASDPAVVAIHVRRARCDGIVPESSCTGTLIAKRVVLTAAHCVEPEASGLSYEVAFGGVNDATAERRVVVALERHPKFVKETYAFDIALLLLGEDGPVEPIALPAVAPVPAVSDVVRAVGFGISGAGDKPGTKRAGVMSVSMVAEDSFRSIAAPGMSCTGDSGGPVFLPSETGPEVLIGVTSSGDTQCRDYARNYRIDAARELIDAFVARANMLPPGPPEGAIDPERLCSIPCATSMDCPAGLLCQQTAPDAKRCVLPGSPPGDFGAKCSETRACAAGETCMRFWTSGEFACLCQRPCSGGPAPPPPLDGGAPIPPSSATVGYRAGGGGCSTTHVPSSGSWVAVTLLAALLRRRRDQP